MLKFSARESYCFTLIVLSLQGNKRFKKNTEQYLLFSNSGRFSWYGHATGSNRVKKSFRDPSAKHYQGLCWMSTSFHHKNRLSWWLQYPNHDDTGIKSIWRSWCRPRRFICDKTRTWGKTSLCRLEMPFSLRKGTSNNVFFSVNSPL